MLINHILIGPFLASSFKWSIVRRQSFSSSNLIDIFYLDVRLTSFVYPIGPQEYVKIDFSLAPSSDATLNNNV